jgi:hypothetical protein
LTETAAIMPPLAICYLMAPFDASLDVTAAASGSASALGNGRKKE